MDHLWTAKIFLTGGRTVYRRTCASNKTLLTGGRTVYRYESLEGPLLKKKKIYLVITR